MTDRTTTQSGFAFAARGSHGDVEEGLVFTPKLDADGLIPAIVTDAASGKVVMFAWMNAEALARSIETGEAHFYSRSRKTLWRKGEESGNVLEIAEMRTDCDQDAIWMAVRIAGQGAACHTGRLSCFYRAIALRQPAGDAVRLVRVDDAKAFDPAAVYAAPAKR